MLSIYFLILQSFTFHTHFQPYSLTQCSTFPFLTPLKFHLSSSKVPILSHASLSSGISFHSSLHSYPITTLLYLAQSVSNILYSYLGPIPLPFPSILASIHVQQQRLDPFSKLNSYPRSNSRGLFLLLLLFVLSSPFLSPHHVFYLSLRHHHPLKPLSSPYPIATCPISSLYRPLPLHHHRQAPHSPCSRVLVSSPPRP